MARLMEAWPTPRISSISACFMPTLPPASWCLTITEVVGLRSQKSSF